ncbi:hypothetical protein [Azospirillum sp. TSO22-1]|uniref:hypothetical protein n=1 Tax=Azospirillum sp. TSO22-1 TaxID=716789 RepID=UPI000D621C7B|nr:hypothetical protein [Azospirillum sp. TSO22-1]PWC45871.1 hypothetical protein TSO221_15060 [Azospirillum sp. TSO22-1]
MTTQQSRPPSSAVIAQTITATKVDTSKIIELLTETGAGEEDRIEKILQALAMLLEMVTAMQADLARLASAAAAKPPH